MCGLTWVKSVGLNGMVMPNSGNAYDNRGPPSSSSFTVSGPLACNHHCTPCCAPKARSRATSSSDKGSRWRSTSAVTSSPQASSICGQVSRASMPKISSRSGIIIALTCGGSTWQTCMSAT
ncbi:hypothetical protein D9M68_820170 [compost metagenome]